MKSKFKKCCGSICHECFSIEDEWDLFNWTMKNERLLLKYGLITKEDYLKETAKILKYEKPWKPDPRWKTEWNIV